MFEFKSLSPLHFETSPNYTSPPNMNKDRMMSYTHN